MATIDKAYDEYRQIVKTMQTDASKETLYEQLMTKEENVLGLIGRIANNHNADILAGTLLYNKSVFEILLLFANTWKQIIREIFVEKQSILTNYKHIFYDNDRKLYTGMMLIVCTIFVFFVDAASR